MESLLRGLFENHVDLRKDKVKPAGFNFKGDNISVFKLAGRSINEAITHFNANISQYDYFANFNDTDLDNIIYSPRYVDNPTNRNPFHGTIYVSLPKDEIKAKQILLVVKQELAEISQLVKY